MKKYNFITKKFLLKEYIKNKKTGHQIAKLIGCNWRTTYNMLDRYNIKRRTQKESHNKYSITKKFLIKEYTENRKSIEEIAKKLNYSIIPIRNRLIEYNIRIRTRSEAKKGKILTKEHKKKLSLSHGGTGISHELSGYGAEFDNSLKEQVRFRDNYKCQVCGCSQLENGKQLDCHHIDYNKKHNKLSNLIALCRSCHMRTNSNGNYWVNYFRRERNGTIVQRKIKNY